MNTVILDLETTGDNHLIDEICQLSYIILDKNFNILNSKNFFFKVEYVHFKSKKKKLDIDELNKLSNGNAFKDLYDEIFNDLNNSLIVCHNCEHDISFIKSEFMRCDNQKKFIYEEFCTMKYYTDILKIPSDNFIYKYPKLIEIMPYLNIKRGDIARISRQLFDMNDGIEFHDSRVDVSTTYLVATKTDELKFIYEDIVSKLEHKEQSLVMKDIYIDNANISKSKMEDINKEESQIQINKTTKKDKNFIKNIYTFKGTMSRKQFVTSILYRTIITCILVYGTFYIYDEKSEYMNRITNYILAFVFMPAVARRLRDINGSLWWSLLLFFGIFRIILILDLSLTKGKNTNITRKKIKISKKYIFTVSIVGIAILILSINTYLNNIENEKINQAIDIVAYTIDTDRKKLPYKYISEYIEERVEAMNPYHIDGWYGEKVDGNTYLVTYDFDKNDDNYSNGYSCYAYEVNLDTKEVIEISSSYMIDKYYELGYFDEEICTNEFINEEYKAVELAKSYKFGNESNSLNIHANMNKIMPNNQRGWHAEKVSDYIYLVTYDFDKYDDNYSNGYNCYAYEVNLKNKDVKKINSKSIINKYEELGYFERICVNEYDT